jgi:hypothetical protein
MTLRTPAWRRYESTDGGGGEGWERGTGESEERRGATDRPLAEEVIVDEGGVHGLVRQPTHPWERNRE